MKDEILKILIKFYPNFANNEKCAEEIELLFSISKITMIPVTSSQIKSIGYDSGTLYIEFNKGTVYTYSNVPEGHYKALITPDHSVGQYFVNHIKGKYDFIKTDKIVTNNEIK